MAVAVGQAVVDVKAGNTVQLALVAASFDQSCSLLRSHQILTCFESIYLYGSQLLDQG